MLTVKKYDTCTTRPQGLDDINFYGNCEYLEDVVSQIDTPVLDNITITLFDRPVFDTPLLLDFIYRTENLKAPHRAEMSFSSLYIKVELFRREEGVDHKVLDLSISCSVPDWPLSSLAQICGSLLAPLSALEHLDIYKGPYNGRMTWKTPNGWNFSTLSPL